MDLKDILEKARKEIKEFAGKRKEKGDSALLVFINIFPAFFSDLSNPLLMAFFGIFSKWE